MNYGKEKDLVIAALNMVTAATDAEIQNIVRGWGHEFSSWDFMAARCGLVRAGVIRSVNGSWMLV